MSNVSEDLEKLPGTSDLRSRIESVRHKGSQYALKFAWLGLCRASEVVGKACKSDKGTTPRGPMGCELDLTEYVEDGLRVDTVLFKVKTSKRGGLERIAAYPLDSMYEPWASQLCDYIQEFSPSQPVFDFTRQRLWQIARAAFDGLTYPIEQYNRIIQDHELKEGMVIVKDRGSDLIVKQMKHRRAAGPHSIRHIRVVDLMKIHGFSLQEVSIIGGWTLRSFTGSSSALARYAHLGWRSYYPRMLINRGF